MFCGLLRCISSSPEVLIFALCFSLALLMYLWTSTASHQLPEGMRLLNCVSFQLAAALTTLLVQELFKWNVVIGTS